MRIYTNTQDDSRAWARKPDDGVSDANQSMKRIEEMINGSHQLLYGAGGAGNAATEGNSRATIGDDTTGPQRRSESRRSVSAPGASVYERHMREQALLQRSRKNAINEAAKKIQRSNAMTKESRARSSMTGLAHTKASGPHSTEYPQRDQPPHSVVVTAIHRSPVEHRPLPRTFHTKSDMEVTRPSRVSKPPVPVFVTKRGAHEAEDDEDKPQNIPVGELLQRIREELRGCRRDRPGSRGRPARPPPAPTPAAPPPPAREPRPPVPEGAPAWLRLYRYASVQRRKRERLREQIEAEERQKRRRVAQRRRAQPHAEAPPRPPTKRDPKTPPIVSTASSEVPRKRAGVPHPLQNTEHVGVSNGRAPAVTIIRTGAAMPYGSGSCSSDGQESQGDTNCRVDDAIYAVNNVAWDKGQMPRGEYVSNQLQTGEVGVIADDEGPSTCPPPPIVTSLDLSKIRK